MDIQLGNRTITAVDSVVPAIALLLWGDAGCGKTTLASTAPGKKLWLQFDRDGVVSLRGRDDVLCLDLSGEKHSIVAQLKADNVLGIEKVLIDNPDIETVVLDSLTSLVVLATDNAVAEVTSATNENPGLKGFGHRNAVVLKIVTNLMRLTKRLNRNIIFIAHEDSPQMSEDGKVVVMITLALGGKQTNQIALALNEVWWMQDTGKERRIAVRPCRSRKPMKSRMFDASASPEFVWKYDANKWSGDGLETWFNQWKKGGCRKLALPK